MNTDETGEIRYHGDVRRSFLVTLEREVTVRQYQVVSIEVEAASEEDAERRAALAVEDEDFDEEEWAVVGCNGTHYLLRPPSVDAIEVISGQKDTPG